MSVATKSSKNYDGMGREENSLKSKGALSCIPVDQPSESAKKVKREYDKHGNRIRKAPEES